ncbi:MAG: hypothetical protein FWE68_04300 [Defluviitaleaceae bacterium]|nr:hypothetical protein [Defluviitaleaceae bacterium]
MNYGHTNYELWKKIVLKYPDDIMFPYVNLLEPLGFEGLCAITAELAGTRLYIPSVRSMFRDCIAHEIRKDFNGRNYNELCKSYGYSESTIRYMVRSMK